MAGHNQYIDSFRARIKEFRSYTSNRKILDRKYITMSFTYWYMTPQLWKEFKSNKGEIIKFDKFTDFVTDKVHGPGFKLKFFQDIIKCPDAEKELQGMEALNELVKMKEDVRRGVIASIDAIPKNGTNRYSSFGDPKAKTENNIKYWTARAKRDNPQVHQDILDGKIKTTKEIKNALGVVESSIRCRVPKDPTKLKDYLINKFGEDYWQQAIKM